MSLERSAAFGRRSIHLQTSTRTCARQGEPKRGGALSVDKAPVNLILGLHSQSHRQPFDVVAHRSSPQVARQRLKRSLAA